MNRRDFTELKERVAKIETLCNSILGSNEIGEISLDEPEDPLDELYFWKTIGWSYALFFETGAFFRFSKTLVRAANPVAFRKFQETTNIMHASRTVHGHNLRRDSSSDQATRQRFDIWLRSAGGTPTEWDRCISTLIGDICAGLQVLESTWAQKCREEWGREETISSYFEHKKNYWEAHEFDRFVELAAREIGLLDFDCVKFRSSNGRLERWRRLVEFFQTRQGAETALRRAILKELMDVFGARR